MSNNAYAAPLDPQLEAERLLLEATESKGSSLPDKQEGTLESDAALLRTEPEYLRGGKLAVVFGSLLLSVLLVNLDQTIVATALPRIVSVFNALDLATWVAAAYFLTQAGLMLCVGQLVDTIPIKTVYVISIVVFELGSVLCGAAPSMRVLIFGRAVAGCGAAGITICSVATIATVRNLAGRSNLDFGTTDD
ncbi:uncharacterized protein PHACADRAFT_214769 [Phanerochaete carnosa HHB-10118-sp]|uniref:Major facilitator superfamily (MFS) profile domain-containing protein n=1 Tax=Phanerochaete carnosa (strain HHB-10118-sp) TaxID=650164 RepID=K5VPK8_PHACS|nr:uncharacterized protein PHACADRAFT_214769 [Phanerochaete carnosa HHB-10118-sp]EKM48514.1 hypothetical protein PHACADRAFT_214769 [Phanerochaete carnosa HHB-10118-sp]